MDYSNYTVFAILKFKIDFLDVLEYTLLNYNVKKETIDNKLKELNEEYENGLYHQIISSLFTSYKKLNKPISLFLKKYDSSSIFKIVSKEKTKSILNYNESLIDCYETFNHIIDTFLEEETIKSKLTKDIISLIDISKEHFTYFLFFNMYYLLISKKLSKKERTRTLKILNYCNKSKNFNKYLESEENNDNIEKLSNSCITLEKQQSDLLNKIVQTINNELKNK